MPEPLVFLNDCMVPASQAGLKVYDLGVITGATVTEMVRTFHKRLYRLEQHLQRLAGSLSCVRFDLGKSIEELGKTACELVEHNARLLGPDDELAIVLFITPGESPYYAGMEVGNVRTGPTVCVHTFPLPFKRWAEKMEHGDHLVIPSIRHVPPQCYNPAMKHRSRMNYYLADQEARQTAPDASALLLDLDDNVTETGTASFFIVDGGTIVSPMPGNILPGISRTVVVELAEKLDITLVERDFQVSDAINAEEAFTTSTPYCIMPVTRIDGRPVGDGRPGPIYQRLLEAWSREVGLDIKQQVVSRGWGLGAGG